jgi:hypothetical protein
MDHIRSQELVDSALLLSDIGLIDADNALVHGVAVQTIRRWRREYQRRGQPRGQAHTSVACPRCDAADLDGAAFAHLLGWYLGDGHISQGRRDVLALHIFNDRRYPGLNAEIADTMRAVKPGGRVHTRLLSGAVVTTVSWKHWPCLFPQHGPGRKHQRPIVLADWQREIVVRHPERFVRGLFHSDGCRITNWTVRTVAGRPKRYEYPRYLFSNESADIVGLCTWALDLLGVAWRLPRHNMVSVARREAVAVLDTHVGPKT